ncbi:MAG: nuclear transport factor 2 family protein [Parachlamydia sp.]|nr:nuclear transport factor 2 family protein [Parachlamydia sp.]
MSTQENVQIVKDFFAAMGRANKKGLLELSAEDIEWIIPGEDWSLVGTHRGHAGLTDLLQKASETVETSTEPLEFVAQGDRVLVVGFASGRIIATNKTFKDDWVFAITVRNGKLTNIREYIDTQALARAAEMDASHIGNEEIIRKLYAVAEGSGLDTEKFVSFFSEKGYMYDVPSGTKFLGKAIGDSIAALASAFPDVHRELLSIYVAENVVVVELRIRGTHKGELALGSKIIAPTGRAIDVPCVDVFHLESGKVISFNCYNSPSVMQQQLGPVSS